MPASLTYYREKTASKAQIEFLSGDTDYAVIQEILNLYDKNDNIIGTNTSLSTLVRNPAGDIILTGNSYVKFNELSGYPYGDDNIFSFTFTIFNKLDFTTGLLVDGTYPSNSNACSTGEYANQVAYAQLIRDSTQKYDKVTVNFPLPTLTYTNAFNSLPQPSTAPLPA
jgi:hypothetical protein